MVGLGNMFLLFEINNPWKTKSDFSNIYCFNKQIADTKSFEFEVFKNSTCLIEVQLDFRLKGRDHAGISATIILFGFGFGARIYDHRHWDYEKNTWENK